MVSDGKSLFLVGYYSVHRMQPGERVQERGRQDSNLQSPVLETGAVTNLATAPVVRAARAR